MNEGPITLRILGTVLAGVVAVALIASADAAKVFAQPLANLPIVLSHFGVKAKDMAAQKRFWVATLGGKPGLVIPPNTPGNHPFHVAFPKGLVELGSGESRGGTKGSTIDHVAFQVRNLRRMVAVVKQAGFRIVTSEEMPAGGSVKDDIGALPGETGAVAYVMGPDDIKVELLENSAMNEPIAFDHVHLMAPAGQRAAMLEWYKRAAAATDGKRGSWYQSLDMPGYKGVMLFSDAQGLVQGTGERPISHVGFEVRDLPRVFSGLQKRIPGLPAFDRYPLHPDVTFTFTKDPFGTDVQFGEHPSGLFFESK